MLGKSRPPAQAGSPTIRILSFLKGHSKTVAFLIALVIIAAGFDIVVPFISQRLIDTLIGFLKNGGPAPTTTLVVAAVGILVFTILNRVIKTNYDFRLFKLVTTVEDRARYQTYEKYLNLHSLFHHGASSGQMIGRLEKGAQAVYVILYDLIGESLLPPLVTFIGVLVALFYKNWIIAIAVFIPLPVYLIIVRHLTNRIYEIEKKSNDAFEAVAREQYDVAANVLTVKKFSQEHIETDRQRTMQADARRIQYDAERLWSTMESLQTAIATAGRIAVMLIAGFLVLKGRSTIGEFVLYITLQNMAYGPLAQLSIIFPRFRRNMSRAERLFQIMDETVKVKDAPDAMELLPLATEMEYENVGFQYGSGRWALRNVAVKIPVHKTIALVGRSGSGKTTFINLLLRSFDPQEGAIMIDGRDLREVTQVSLRNQIAVVPQEVDLFSRTIKENIAYGKPDATKADIIQAAKTGLAHDFIMKLEKGYDTVVGERGIKLSGGERQRIGITRAILRDPRILILDEATSHLDTESERLIQKATEVLMKDRTTFIIAHRLSTILNADMIAVFKGGRIEAIGTHKELLKTSPTYKRLHDLQFANT
ncbi:MAG: hypothetical protein A3A33_04710 [Candidatus Yanofskybacteria bacterium RIFCSPLOWO2_01_FULL_49_25]|uniref:ABC transporter n=1 Tax=Candidatus Yanofskybacteria bacterium RIFCSPLOWO2_01_FULL_49_25 TaxID=1802701 RepID=A0A1F8GPY1_9BACT|nr:MAG: hypothetical protein A3A33_04710 [Candidatus Yanofskybacteria bacterium RIFCSPLOWO2_01_FULL_49_25]